MATVSITSDLEPYLASLRTYLAQNATRPEDEIKDPAPNAVQNRPGLSSLQKEIRLSNGDKNGRVSVRCAKEGSPLQGSNAGSRSGSCLP
ncbi:hypothetical protein BO94DRAFT_533944 [Aspergillus terreus]|uniref:Uncharacterized protein n=1 Tax=Aspergillus terreus TaxID=33178 RepID=A0A5M3Z790_ASPTE|nr:hypothetical protein HFD88_002052 [Aspergillus terreus]GES63101.1 hypothetical protein ATETN484_0008038900 [Aspergillus terreus]GFF21217.1 hypothetical protein BO94DRAFT_533944 [Aspergillus terreus]